MFRESNLKHEEISKNVLKWPLRFKPTKQVLALTHGGAVSRKHVIELSPKSSSGHFFQLQQPSQKTRVPWSRHPVSRHACPSPLACSGSRNRIRLLMCKVARGWHSHKISVSMPRTQIADLREACRKTKNITDVVIAQLFREPVPGYASKADVDSTKSCRRRNKIRSDSINKPSPTTHKKMLVKRNAWRFYNISFPNFKKPTTAS